MAPVLPVLPTEPAVRGLRRCCESPIFLFLRGKQKPRPESFMSGFFSLSNISASFSLHAIRCHVDGINVKCFNRVESFRFSTEIACRKGATSAATQRACYHAKCVLLQDLHPTDSRPIRTEPCHTHTCSLGKFMTRIPRCMQIAPRLRLVSPKTSAYVGCNNAANS